MITMLSDSMMTWLTPTIRPGEAEGIITFHSSWRRVQPAMWPDSMDSDGTWGQRQHGDPDHGRRGVDHGRDHGGHRSEPEQEQHRNEVGEYRRRLHQVQHRFDGPGPNQGGPVAPGCRSAVRR